MKRGLLLILACVLISAPMLGQTALPEGNSGIAASYPEDANILSNANVLFADDFESYSSAGQLESIWDGAYHGQNTRIATEPANVYSGARSLEFTIPATSSEVSNALVKRISPTQDILFVRIYTKFDPSYHITTGSNHNGIRISSRYSGPGNTPNGNDFFMAILENSIYYGESAPGYTHAYVYHPDQRSQWGDNWFPDGKVLPYDNTPGDFGQNFVARENFIPQRDQWYSYEFMMQANTPGQQDGRVAFWIDGELKADFQNVRLRDVNTLKIDEIQLEHHANAGGSSRTNIKWFDNVVVATSYIGPMSSSGSCTDECVSGERQCSGAGYQICGNYDSDSCTEWSEVTECAAGQICVNGECSQASCIPDWQCTDWSACSGGIQTRTCSDANGCGITTGKPEESQSCGSAVNVVENGDFESGFTDGIGDGWVIEADGSIAYTPSQDTGYQGSSQKVSITQAGSWGLILFQQPDLELGKSYTLSFWYKGMAGYAQMADPSATSFLFNHQLPASSQWEFYTFEFTYTDAQATDLRFPADTVGDFWVDEVRIEEVGITNVCSDADTDCDGCVDLDELIEYINKWKVGQVEMAQLMEAIAQWKNGC